MTIRVGPEDRYTRLLQYLEAGWEIDPPVIVSCCKYSEADESYQFVLCNGERRWLLSVPAAQTVTQFIDERDLPVYRL